MNRIRQLREEKDITQLRLSMELEVSQEAVSAYEVGKHYPSIKSLLKLREIFHVSIDYILGLTDERCSTVRENDLQPAEIDIIEMFRGLDHAGKERLCAYMQGYVDAKQN